MNTPTYPVGDAVAKTSLPLQSWSPDLYLEFCSAGDPRYKVIRKEHYVVPKGCHGQQVHFLVWYKKEIAGIISGGSPVFATAARDFFFKITKENRTKVLNGIIDNVVFRLVNHEHNLGSRVLTLWEKAAIQTWEALYEVRVFGFEAFIVPEGWMKEEITEKQDNLGRPLRRIVVVADAEGHVRYGDIYKAANWDYAGKTSGSTKGHDGVGLTGGRADGKGSFLRKTTPIKNVYCKWVAGFSLPVESAYKSSWKAATKEGTPEERETAKTKSLVRKSLMGRCFYLKARRLVNENF
jgi:hypothetical protein